jgi:hypothetical protein
VRIIQRVKSCTPPLVAERRICDHIIERLEGIEVPELGIRDRVALNDQRGRHVVKNHVHAGKAARSRVLFLPVQRDGRAGLVSNLQEHRAGTAGWVIHSRIRARLGGTDAHDLGDDAANLGRCIKLALALAALGREMPHEVFVGVAENVVAFGAIL